MRLLPLAVVLACRTDPVSVCGPQPDDSAEAENVLIVLLDDIGVEQVKAYTPSAVPLTPTFDCLCEQGVRFEQAWSTPLCSPSRAALLTGLHSDRNGLGYNVLESGSLALDAVTLGELAQEAGFTTGLFGKWHLDGWESPYNITGPRVQGFDVFTGTPGNLQEVGAPTPQTGDRSQYEGYWRVVNGALQWTRGYATTVTIDDALAFIDDAKGPWLVVVSLHAAHVPMHEPPRALLSTPLPEDPTDLDRYRAIVEAADTEIGRLLQTIPERTARATNVVVVADNGTSPFGQAVDERGHAKATLYEGGVRVPLVVSGPGISAGVTNGLVHLVDVFPTVADWIGSPADVDGTSLVPLLADPAAEGRPLNLTVWNPDNGPADRAVRDADYKLIRLSFAEELYDLRVDPDERDERIALGLSDEDRDAWMRLGSALDAREQSYGSR